MDYKDNLLVLKVIEQFVTATKKVKRYIYISFPLKKTQRNKPVLSINKFNIDNFHLFQKDFFSIHPVPAPILRGNTLYIYLGISVAVM